MQYPADIFTEYEAQLGGEPVSSETSKNGRIDWKAIFAGAVFAGGLVWAAHIEIDKINDRLVALDKHISRVETAVRIIGAKQGGDTKTLIDEALIAAKKASDAGRAENAKAALEVADHLIAVLPSDAFQAALPELKSALATGKKAGLPVSPKVMIDLQSKLLDANHEASGYWPVVAEFISYRSVSAVSAPLNLPNCVDQEPSLARIITSDSKGFTFSRRIYENCKLSLDSPIETAKINWLVTNTAPALTFRHCLITYHGGPVSLIVAVTKLPVTVQIETSPPVSWSTTMDSDTLFFENCAFNFSFDYPPPQEGQRVAESLLAQSATFARLTLEGPSTNALLESATHY